MHIQSVMRALQSDAKEALRRDPFFPALKRDESGSPFLGP